VTFFETVYIDTANRPINQLVDVIS